MQILSLVLLGIFPVLALAVLNTPDQSYVNGYQTIFEGERDFSIRMMQQIRKIYPNGNLFFSPFSTYNALLIAYFGSSKETEMELYNVLNLKWASKKEQVLSAYVVNKGQHQMRVRQSPLELSSVNRVFVDNSVPVSENFTTLLFDEIEKMDFRYQSGNALYEINEWIAEKTNNQIRDMLSADQITARTMVVLANAAYMKGEWLSQFKVEKTSVKPFYINRYERTMVSMMQQSATFKTNDDSQLQAQILKLPYRTQYKSKDPLQSRPENKSDISMVLILPSSSEVSVDDIINRLNADKLKKLVKEIYAREMEVELPKFQFEQRLRLTPILGRMGIRTMFENRATFEDLTSEHISIDDALHVAKIKVDEMGSTAAAATVLFSSRSARQPDPTKFICDHPFLFLIYDERANTVLFAGVYSDPRQM
ncbi:serine protease inhibitor 88Ea [Drosophila subpulchrella]|uniref:serine protease inhibitor 88Ea n=1 Tax=Drosophila subpulchrella TaxID=1486046 RepID=UPI0018A183E8|nr:serine protease inhibitor 88Ea [Drosophila subpulchrella]